MKAVVLALQLLFLSSRTQATTTTTTMHPPSNSSSPRSNPSTNISPVGAVTNNPQGVGADRTSGRQQPTSPPLPVWAQCLSKAPIDAPHNSSVASLFQHWCSNYNEVIPCVEAGLATDTARNPLDLFVKLHFDAQQLKKKSAELCQSFQAIRSRLQCTQQNNATLETWCRGRFSQGLQYVFAVQMQGAFDNDANVYKQLACRVTEDTSGCLGAAMTTCDAEVKRNLLAYYAFYTNDTCLADPNAVYTTPAPPPRQQPPPRDVVIICAERVAQTVPQSEPLPKNATHLEQLVYGLRQNCRSFEARYNCYDQELNKITIPSFRDIWLSFTFDSANAIKSQRDFCNGFEGGAIGSLNADCYNKTQPRLRRCEDIYGQAVVNVQKQWAQNRLDNVAVHQAACRISMRRAFCLREAFQLCGTPLAEAMLASELGTLPDICFTLPDEDNKTSRGSPTTSHDDGYEPVSAAETTEDRSSGSHSAGDNEGRRDSASSQGGRSQATSRLPGPSAKSSAEEKYPHPASSGSEHGATADESKGGNSATPAAVASFSTLALVVFLISILV